MHLYYLFKFHYQHLLSIQFRFKWGISNNGSKRANGYCYAYLYYAGAWQRLYAYTTTQYDSEFYYDVTINSGTPGGYVTSALIEVYMSGGDWNRSGIVNPPAEMGGGWFTDILPVSYTGTLGSATVLANGTLSWLAVGK